MESMNDKINIQFTEHELKIIKTGLVFYLLDDPRSQEAKALANRLRDKRYSL